MMQKREYFTAAVLFLLVSFLAFFYYYSKRFSPLEGFIVQSVVFLLIPVSIFLGSGQKLSDIGVSFSEKKKIFLYAGALIGIAIPVMLYASTLPEFQNYYPRFFAANLQQFAYFELLVLPEFLFLEFFYRGFALFQFKKILKNDFAAILLQNIPYFLIHWGKPLPEFYYSFFAGIVFAYVCLRAKSFVPAFLSHYIPAVIFDYLNW